MSLNLATMLAETSKRKPDHTALIFDDFKMTYRQLDTASNQFANALVNAGITPGQKWLLCYPISRNLFFAFMVLPKQVRLSCR